MVMSLDSYVQETERQLSNSKHYTTLAEYIAPIATSKISSVLHRIKRMGYISAKHTSGYLDLVQRLEFGVDHLQKNAVYQIE